MNGRDKLSLGSNTNSNVSNSRRLETKLRKQRKAICILCTLQIQLFVKSEQLQLFR